MLTCLGAENKSKTEEKNLKTSNYSGVAKEEELRKILLVFVVTLLCAQIHKSDEILYLNQFLLFYWKV